MRDGIHPDYRLVVFRDVGAGVDHLIRSTARTDRTCVVGGVELPLVTVEVSAASHPYYTGKVKLVDTAGRVERFERRYGARRREPG
ncbi:MAG: type B 50S ribosomal protein L31 [Acidimicrobiia bacterium]